MGKNSKSNSKKCLNKGGVMFPFYFFIAVYIMALYFHYCRGKNESF
ncbi:hypothetical protein LAh8_14 [Aeromonas phage LAh_8]|uniref:Uncharacterized protein n=1 Tax=Aeromonas phage LAh_8 TaxID=2591032 RepID=A0A514A0S7_9CAUD|nr:hypothetical protein HWC31_gp014 [Aeromonas phage LAh_8]QDH46856.1 hypothetical protein LAh8_14 [Aeromonas phage LAh_8]